MTAELTKDDLKRALIRKFGFEEEQGGNHEKLVLRVGGKKVATTYFSRKLRSTGLGAPLLRQIAGQLRLPPGSLPTLRGMVDCLVNRDQYLKELKDRSYLS